MILSEGRKMVIYGSVHNKMQELRSEVYHLTSHNREINMQLDVLIAKAQHEVATVAVKAAEGGAGR